MYFHLLSFIQPEPLWPDACGLPRRLHHQHGQSASRGKVLGAIFKFYKHKSFTSQPLGKPKEQFHNILQYLALETSISTTFRMLEYYNANDEVEQMIRRLFRCEWKMKKVDFEFQTIFGTISAQNQVHFWITNAWGQKLLRNEEDERRAVCGELDGDDLGPQVLVEITTKPSQYP